MLQSPQNPARTRILFYTIACSLVGASLAAGYYLPANVTDYLGLSSPQPESPPSCCCTSTKQDELPPCCAAKLAAAPTIAEFPLSDADRKDQLEAPTLAVDALGRVFCAWASQTDEKERTLFLATSLNNGQSFDPPKPVQRSQIYSFSTESRGKTITRSIRMVPHLAAASDRLAVAWLDSANDNTTVKMMLAESSDGGLSFNPPICVHENDKARPTFTSLAASAAGQIAASWIDHREGVQHPFFAVRPREATAFMPEVKIPAGEENRGICPCCPTTSVVAADGTVYVAFRNLAAGYRDMFVAKWTEQGLENPVPVVEPTWQFDGCPHDGPSLAVVGETLHIVWMDGRSGVQRVYYGSAATNDLKFTTRPLHAAGPGTQGNAKLAVTATGLVAVWEESCEETAETATAEPAKESSKKHAHALTGSGRRVMAMFAPAGGEFGPAVAVLDRPGRFQTRPAVIGVEEGKYVVAMNELDAEGKRVVIVRQPLPRSEATENLATESPMSEKGSENKPGEDKSAEENAAATSTPAASSNEAGTTP